MVSAAAGNTKIRVLNAAGFYPQAWVELDTGAKKYYRQCLAVDGAVLTIDGPKPATMLFDPAVATTSTRVSSCEFGLNISYPDAAAKITVAEQLSGMTIANVPGRYFRDVMRARTSSCTATAPQCFRPIRPAVTRSASRRAHSAA